jgi:hypothetical protein
VPNNDLQGDTGSHAEAEEVGVFDAKLLESGRSISAVRPWACISKAITCLLLASFGRTAPKEVPIAEKAP